SDCRIRPFFTARRTAPAASAATAGRAADADSPAARACLRLTADNSCVLIPAPRFLKFTRCTGIENETQRALHGSGQATGRHLAELRVDLLALWIELRCCVYARELCVVESVVGLPSELHASALASEREPLAQRHVPNVDAGQPDHNAGCIAWIIRTRRSESAG